jgi:DNA-binding response OmpR family regulator
VCARSCLVSVGMMAQILYVEDDESVREALAKFLVVAGHKVFGVQNGKDAMVELLQRPPDVILLDLHLPGMNGPSFLEALRSYLQVRTVPVIIVTGLEEGPMIDRVQAMKVSCILTKGKATGGEVLKAISDVLARDD